MVRTWWVGAYRLAFAALATVAVVYTAYLSAVQGRSMVGFFSFFTNESNILGIVVFAWGGVAALTGRRGAPDLLRGATVVYLVVTGVVYALLLAGLPGQNISPWANDVVHRVMPVVIVLDWLIMPPRAGAGAPALTMRRAWSWLVFPLVYLAYTLIRGPFANWYPYPFLDPRTHGYLKVITSSLGIAVAFVVLTVLVRWVGVAIGNRRAPALEAVNETRPASVD